MPRSPLFLALLLLLAPLRGLEQTPLPPDDLPGQVASILASEYYDPTRIRPRLMVERALRSLEGGEAGIDAQSGDDAITLDLLGERVRVPLAAADTADIAGVARLLQRLTEVLRRSERVPADRKGALGYNMINAALASLDPHTVVMPPAPASEFNEDIRGEFFGVGAYLNQEDGVIRIDRVMPGLPADMAGVKDGDVILRIDGERTVGLLLPQAVQRIKGPKGTTVTLTVERAGASAPIDIPVVRDRVAVVALRTWRQGAVGYLRMDDFNQNTARDLSMALGALQKQGPPLSGLVLDLRFNGGGLLKAARVISDFFLPPGREIVRTVSLGEQPAVSLSSSQVLYAGPMLVLVGPNSASASEILAGALQVNDRAVVIGTTTFGKGSVQTVRELRDGSQLKFTVQEYQLAGGVSIQERGVVPDVALLRRVQTGTGTVDLQNIAPQREADAEFHLNGHDTYRNDSALRLGWLQRIEDDATRDRSRISARDYQPDQEARLAVDLLTDALAGPTAANSLAAAGMTQRKPLIELLRPAVAARQPREDTALATVLAAQQPPIDWRAGAAAGADAGLQLSYLGPERVRAGTRAVLRFAVTNRGETVQGRLYALVDAPDSSVFWARESLVGSVAAGATAAIELTVEVPPRVDPGRERFTVRLLQDGREGELARTEVTIDLDEQPRPSLDYRWRLLDRTAIERDQDLELELVVMNNGNGPSAPIALRVFKDDDPFVQLREGRFSLPALAPGEEATAIVPFTVRSAPPAGMRARQPGNAVLLQIRAEERFDDAIDGRNRAAFFHQLRLGIDSVLPGGEIVTPRVHVQAKTDGAVARLQIDVRDDNPRFLSVFRGEDKIALRVLSGTGPQMLEVPLLPGRNELRILVIDEDEVAGGRQLTLWGPEAAQTTAAAPTATVAPRNPAAPVLP